MSMTVWLNCRKEIVYSLCSVLHNKIMQQTGLNDVTCDDIDKLTEEDPFYIVLNKTTPHGSGTPSTTRSDPFLHNTLQMKS